MFQQVTYDTATQGQSSNKIDAAGNWYSYLFTYDENDLISAALI